MLNVNINCKKEENKMKFSKMLINSVSVLFMTTSMYNLGSYLNETNVQASNKKYSTEVNLKGSYVYSKANLKQKKFKIKTNKKWEQLRSTKKATYVKLGKHKGWVYSSRIYKLNKKNTKLHRSQKGSNKGLKYKIQKQNRYVVKGLYLYKDASLQHRTFKVKTNKKWLALRYTKKATYVKLGKHKGWVYSNGLEKILVKQHTSHKATPTVTPAKPADNNKPTVEPAKPADNNKPTVEPAKPADNNKPTVEPAKPAENNKPTVTPVKPAENNKPTVTPAKPADNNKPANNDPFAPDGSADIFNNGIEYDIYHQTVSSLAFPDYKVGDQETNSIPLSNEYISDLKNGVKNLPTINSELVVTKDDFYNNVDLNNMTADQQRELSEFTSKLVNSLRHQFGNDDELTTTNNGVQQFANDIAQQYDNDNWSMFKKGHDDNGINMVASKYGLRTHYPYTLPYEDASVSSDLVPQKLNMASLKAMTYDSIIPMLNDDAMWDNGHAKDLTGITDKGYGSAYLAVSYDKQQQLHIITVPTGFIINHNAEHSVEH
jgi:hypothetical protein